MKHIGFFGYGQMGGALAEGLYTCCERVKAGEVKLHAYAPHTDALRMRTAGTPVEPCDSAEELIGRCDALVIACKPYQVENALAPHREALAGKAVVSLVNAWTLPMYRALLGAAARVQTIMPNTPVRVGKGTILLAEENSLLPQEREELRALLGSVAAVIDLPEEKITAAAAIAGCGPAFMYMVIEALGDAGVKNGLPRRLAYDLAAGTMRGAGELALLTQEHPGVLKDAVCSPGGTTIRGVAALEGSGMRAAFIRAVDAALGK